MPIFGPEDEDMYDILQKLPNGKDYNMGASTIQMNLADNDSPYQKKPLNIMSSKIFYVVLQRCLPVLMINGLCIIVGGNGKK